MLLPEGTARSFWTYLAYFLFAQVAGLASHVPGGLGVFETAFLYVAPPEVPSASILGSLIVYRAIYYLVPFFVVLHKPS